jgi:16S rRNA (guanine966-N2)-methyltransferase
MRVVAGRLGGRRLASPPAGADVRPTADRVREAIFSILGDIDGARVLDLFCGTGALGIEALSRGAAAITLVDTDAEPARRNAADLGIEEECEIVRADAMRWLEGSDAAFDLVFCDPPYRLADRLEGTLEPLVAPRLAEGGRLILETSAREPLDLALPVLDERRYGAILVRIHAAGEAGNG